MKSKNIKSMLGALILMVSVNSVADEVVTMPTSPMGSVTVQNRAGVGRSAWITMYNIFGSIREVACVQNNEDRLFSGYYPPLNYVVQAEIYIGTTCSGVRLDRIAQEIDPMPGIYAKLLAYPHGERDAFMWRTSLSPNAVVPQATLDLGKLEDFQKAQSTSDQVLEVQAGGTITADNSLRTGKAAWVTVYNALGSIRDVGCVPAGQTHRWDGYYSFGMDYKVRFEVKDGPACGGATLVDTQTSISVNKGARLINYEEEGRTKYTAVEYAP